ncbi:hypothetical protein BJ508DRAFT_311030 [Ascobolus immersus RN42]|uniref:Uncharacterized protein n=1 Tax=Ascobolus immersus RN42 TaxID=1160509 RepID=A0A3N4HRS3_ASCIM|nr:hypothetical protein BJ508DRAFT_311030 [Ascobolus immersus RN42]
MPESIPPIPFQSHLRLLLPPDSFSSFQPPTPSSELPASNKSCITLSIISTRTANMARHQKRSLQSELEKVVGNALLAAVIGTFIYLLFPRLFETVKTFVQIFLTAVVIQGIVIAVGLICILVRHMESAQYRRTGCYA